jgi:uncharacterized protein YjaZ
MHIPIFKFKAVTLTAILLICISMQTVAADNNQQVQTNVFIEFVDNKTNNLVTRQKNAITVIANSTIKKMHVLMPSLAETIHLKVLVIDRDLSMVNGVTGRADRVNEIEISLSSIYKGGIDKAIEDGLEVVLFHELHHTVRGWTIYGNKFDQGIDIATINEGLADVFAEIQVGHAHNSYDENVDFDSWTKEILALPNDANYGQWMFSHPDGREAIGYRTGAYLIKRALLTSGKNILELSQLSVKDIYRYAGY